MSWLALTTADLALLPQLLEQVRALNVDDNGEAVIAKSIAKVTAQVRSRLPANTVRSADTTLIPSEVTTDAAWLVIEDLVLPLTTVLALTEEQRTRIAAARTAITKDLPAGNIYIGLPADPESSSDLPSGGKITGATVITTGTVRTSRAQLRGL